MSIVTLSKGWKKGAIGDLIESSNTGLVRGAKDQSSSKQFDYFKMNNLSIKGDFDINNLIKVDASEDEVSKFSLNYNDFIFNTRNSVELVGKCGVFLYRTEEKILFNNNLLRIRFNKIEPKIISFWFNSAEGKYQLRNVTSATTSVAAIYQKALLSLEVPIPPLAEQKEIASQLDSLLMKVDSIKNRLDGIPDIIKRFRYSILASAVNGKLTKEWRDKNGQQVKDWKTASLTDATSNIVDCPHSTPKWTDSGKVCVRTTAFNPFNLIIKGQGFVSEETYLDRISRLKPLPGDILYSREGTVGIACQIPEDTELCLGQRMVLIRANDEFNSKFITIVLNSDFILSTIKQLTMGSTVPRINMKDIRSFSIPHPPLNEQKQIVTAVDEFFAFAEKVEQKVNAAQEQVNCLTQSILAKAFRGELTAEWRELNQALITGENSAEALLSKIKAERDALTSKKENKKKTAKK